LRQDTGGSPLIVAVAEVYTSGKSLDDVASQWLTRYADNNAAALAELVGLVVKSAGCNLPLTEDDINDMDNVEGKLGDLQDEYQAVSAGDQLWIGPLS
jgi:cohesin complex subunit SA-1/2